MTYFSRLEEAQLAEHVVFVGYDPIEDAAAKMLASSILRRTTMKELKIVPIVRDQLLVYSICNRPIDPRGSTQFSITRFMVPHLMNFNGIGIFFDCDMLITRDIEEMFELFDSKYAVQLPKHEYEPSTTEKMGGLPQTVYPRKQWSAVVIYNCGHTANKHLTNNIVETSTPKFLHRFEWLMDHEIGSIPLEFNFLVGEQTKTSSLPFNVHHTLGAPIFRDCQDVDYADYWKEEFQITFGREFDPEQDIIN